MDIIKQNIDELNALLKVQIAKTDYEETVKKSLKTYRRKAEIKGFRPGMAPMSLIQKMYGRSVLVEELDKLISESLEKYLKDEQLDIVGEPIPCDDEQKPIDWDNQSDFEFVYEIGYISKYELKIDQTIQVPFYNITVSDNDKSEYIDRIRRRYGKFEDVETIGENDVLEVSISQDGENAMNIESTTISMSTIESNEQKAYILEKKVGDTFAVNINDIYTDDNKKIELLRITATELENINPQFNVKINRIRSLKQADINQELFDTIYGKDNIKSEEEFMQKITAEVAEFHKRDSNYKFSVDVSKTLIEKANLKFPEAFIKKWLLIVNKNELTAEHIDENFELFLRDLNWQTICNNIIKEQDIKVEEVEIQAAAMDKAREQFALYGFKNMPDEQLEHFAQRIISDEKRLRQIAQNIADNKIFDYLKTAVKLEEITINIEDFAKLE
ncbi:MAG: hypothetical protein LBH30_05795 [Prevotellaceae bacterium]|jgi:trigger factor|nr:hypothetical protein [Prevotellaceae bacterium]